MKLMSYLHDGCPSYGVETNEGVIDLKSKFEERYKDLKSLISEGGIKEVEGLLTDCSPDYTMDDIELLPVLPNPGKIWCCGLNYVEHVQETNREVNTKPTFFLRTNDSQVAHQGNIVCPPESTMLDYEGELAIIIGKAGRRISEDDVWDHIVGYACYNDASIRDWQRHSQQWDPGKNFWKTGAFGPSMVTADEIEPNAVLQVTTRLNGEVMQSATTDMMIHSIASQVAYLSTISPLNPGDVIVTGTPGGVGARREPQVWMKSGDVVEVEVERVGLLVNPVVSETEVNN